MRSFQTFRAPSSSWVFIHVWHLFPASHKIPARVAFSPSPYLQKKKKMPSLIQWHTWSIPTHHNAQCPVHLSQALTRALFPASLSHLTVCSEILQFSPFFAGATCFLTSLGFQHDFSLPGARFIYFSASSTYPKSWRKGHSWNTWMKVTRTCREPPEGPGHTLHDCLVSYPIMG